MPKAVMNEEAKNPKMGDQCQDLGDDGDNCHADGDLDCDVNLLSTDEDQV